jgi:glutamate--cysteine ligase
VSQVIDRHDDNYSAAIDSLRRLVGEPDATPSSRIVRELEETGSSFFELARGMAKCHRDYFASIAPLDEEKAEMFAKEATDSLQRQEAIEAADAISLDEYLDQYFRPC